MEQSRKLLYAGLLVVAAIAGALSYKIYQDSRRPPGVEIRVSPQGLSIKEN